ncbi:DVU_1553 family AMP-dependent CoA ligase [Desulfovibrio aminophilus]|uniref:DVU_1553 family AMP-dependent CoA ligase n=1 Tax=Desulfovibrio aminophilus TaxID=81425 RepID=UPI003395047D
MRRTPLDAWIAARLGIPIADLGPEAVEARQLEALRRTLAHAARHSPFYRQRLTGLPTGFPARRTDLATLPLSTAEDLAAHGEAMLCVSGGEIARVVTLETSGTSGPPKRLFFTPEDLEATLDFFAVGISTLVGDGDVALVLLPGRRPEGVADLLSRALPRIGAQAVLPPEPWTPGELARLLERADVTRMVAAPAQMRKLLDHAEFSRAARLRVGAVLSSAEPLDGGLRSDLENTWDCKVFDHWGMTETGYGGGVECAAHAGYHPRLADLFLEVIDPRTAAPLPLGESGELVVSTLNRRGLPLVRYRTGDAARLLPGPCPCGSPLPRLETVPGRIELHDAGWRTVHPSKGQRCICNDF